MLQGVSSVNELLGGLIATALEYHIPVKAGHGSERSFGSDLSSPDQWPPSKMCVGVRHMCIHWTNKVSWLKLFVALQLEETPTREAFEA